MGLEAIALSYVVINMLACVIFSIYNVNRMGFVFTGQNIRLFLVGGFFTLLMLFIYPNSFVWNILKVVLLCLWFLLATGKKEKTLFLSFFKSR